MHNLPPIEPIQIQRLSNETKKQIPRKEQILDDKQECIFFKLPCTAKSQQNKETLKNEKSSLNEAQLELPLNKSLTIKTLPQQIPFRTNTSDQKSHQKGIRLSMGNKRTPVNQIQPIQVQKEAKPNKINQTEPHQIPSITIIAPKQIQNRQKSFHQLNPLSIDRSKYDSNDIKLGGNKVTLQSRVSFGSSYPIEGSTYSFGTFKSIPTTVNRPHILFKASNPLSALPLPSSPYHQNYQKSASYMRNHVFRETFHQNFDLNTKNSQNLTHQQPPHHTTVRYELTSIPIYRCKTQNYQQDSGCTQNNESTNYQQHNTSFNEHSYFEQTQQFFNNIQIQNRSENALRNSIHSNYSQKYRNYMEKELIMPQHTSYQQPNSEMPELMENVRIEVDSVNQEQNQKTQTNLNPNPPKSNHTDRRQQRKGSYSSSFMVIEGKEKQLQSTKKIYLPSNIDTCSIPESGLIHQLDQFMLQEGQIPPNVNSQKQWVSIGEISQLNELQHDVNTLFQTFNNLRSEEQLLIRQNQQLCSMKMQELQQEIRALETLKSISEERRQQIDYLKELLKVKLIQNKFSRSPSLKDKYLNDERGWEKYILYNGESRCLNESNETNETQN